MAFWPSKIRYNHIFYAICATAIVLFLAARQDDTCNQSAPDHRQSDDIPSLEHVTAKFAYTTFLANWPRDDEDNPNDDKYFLATRILAYQLLHAPETKSVHGYPFIVLVNEHVSAAKRERLAKDGAIVWEPKPVDGKW